MQHLNNCGTKTSDGFNSFKYGPSDLCCDHSMPRRDIPLALHRSSTMIISSHGITAYQHHDCCSDVCSDVALLSHDTDLMRCNITCSLGFFCWVWIVCFTSLTDGCTVTCRAFFRLYCWRVRSFRFFLASDDYYWVTVADESNCGGACGVGELAVIGWVAD